MKEITVISGKGGTGKTSIAAALASTASNLVLCDADVDAPDLHLLLHPEIKETHIFKGAWLAEIHAKDCTTCGLCEEYCRFGAISRQNGFYIIDPYRCEGCRLCERICPSKAITSTRSINNHWFISDTRMGPMVHAHMGPGEENSGKLVSQVREKARELAKEQNKDFILTDGPPGTGCATIASVTGSDAVLLVIEPTLSSLHDAQRVIDLVNIFKIPLYALINKASIHPGMADKIEKMLIQEHVIILGRIPFQKEVVESMVVGKTIVEYLPDSPLAQLFHEAWSSLSNIS